jgi:hypothetical protein
MVIERSKKMRLKKDPSKPDHNPIPNPNPDISNQYTSYSNPRMTNGNPKSKSINNAEFYPHESREFSIKEKYNANGKKGNIENEGLI